MIAVFYRIKSENELGNIKWESGHREIIDLICGETELTRFKDLKKQSKTEQKKTKHKKTVYN